MALFYMRPSVSHALGAVSKGRFCLDGDDIIDKISLCIALAALMAAK